MEILEEVNEVDSELKNSLAKNFFPLVKKIVGRIVKRLPSEVDYDDIYSAALFGLSKAINKYDASKESTFYGYVSRKITGAILDELRETGFLSRGLQRTDKEINHAYFELSKLLKREPDAEEVADFLQISLDEFYKLQRKIYFSNVLRLNALIPGSEKDSFIDTLLSDTDLLMDIILREEDDCLREKRKTLRGDYREVIFYYYYCDLSLKEIGLILGVSESRVCQIHAEALASLRKKLL